MKIYFGNYPHESGVCFQFQFEIILMITMRNEMYVFFHLKLASNDKIPCSFADSERRTISSAIPSITMLGDELQVHHVHVTGTFTKYTNNGYSHHCMVFKLTRLMDYLDEVKDSLR